MHQARLSICDLLPGCRWLQGHKLKNPRIQLVQRLTTIPAEMRLIITGTPIQNNLMEMHSLFDFACKVRTICGRACYAR